MFGVLPVIPVTTRVNGVTPVAQLTDSIWRLKEAVHPLGTVAAVKLTTPVKPLMGFTVTDDVPGTVASVVIASADRPKSWIVTERFVVLDRVLGAVPAVPVTWSTKGATPVEQFTEMSDPETVTVQADGTVPVE